MYQYRIIPVKYDKSMNETIGHKIRLTSDARLLEGPPYGGGGWGVAWSGGGLLTTLFWAIDEWSPVRERFLGSPLGPRKILGIQGTFVVRK